MLHLLFITENKSKMILARVSDTGDTRYLDVSRLGEGCGR